MLMDSFTDKLRNANEHQQRGIASRIPTDRFAADPPFEANPPKLIQPLFPGISYAHHRAVLIFVSYMSFPFHDPHSNESI